MWLVQREAPTELRQPGGGPHRHQRPVGSARAGETAPGKETSSRDQQPQPRHQGRREVARPRLREHPARRSGAGRCLSTSGRRGDLRAGSVRGPLRLYAEHLVGETDSVQDSPVDADGVIRRKARRKQRGRAAFFLATSLERRHARRWRGAPAVGDRVDVAMADVGLQRAVVHGEDVERAVAQAVANRDGSVPGWVRTTVSPVVLRPGRRRAAGGGGTARRTLLGSARGP